MDVTNLKDLKSELLKRISDVMIDVAIDAQQVMQERVQKDVYDKYNPEYYQRTGEFKNSVDANVFPPHLNRVKAQIFHNLSLMNPVRPYAGNNYIGQHYSTAPYSPMDYREYLAETINYGIGKGKKKMFGDGVYSRPRPYFDNASKIIEKNFERNFKSGLKATGLKVV